MTQRQITPQEFLNGVELGCISDIFAVGRRIYGKDPRGKSDPVTPERYDIVWADIP